MTRDETLLQLAWIDDENIFEFVPNPLIQILPIRSPLALLAYAPTNVDPTQLASDVLICDFKLVTNASKSPPAVIEAGLDENAAGFLAGLMLAMGNPSRPLAVVPYSGEHTQFNKIWKLSKTFCPTWVVIGEDFHVDKSSFDPRQLIDAAVKAYRALLKKLIQNKQVHISASDRTALLALMQKRHRRTQKLSVDKELQFFFGRERRSIRIGSLFVDLVKNEADASRRFEGAKGTLDAIADYFSFLEAESDDEKLAREIANEFRAASKTNISRKIYENAGDPGIRPEKEKAKPWAHNYSSDESQTNAISLAILRLFVMAYCDVQAVSEAAQRLDAELARDNVPSGSLPVNKIADELISRSIVSTDDAFFLDTLREQARDWAASEFSTLEDLAKHLREERDKAAFRLAFIQLLDPLPKDGIAITTLSKHLRIGARLGERFCDPVTRTEQSASDFESGRLRLSEDHRRYLNDCCRELVPTGLTWPALAERAS